MEIMRGTDWSEADVCENYVGETRQDYMRRIREEDRVIVIPSASELFIDIDTDEDYETFLKGYSILEREHKGVCITRETPSKEGLPHCHIVVEVPFLLNPFQRIAYQAALGSDSTRELLSIFRTENKDSYPTLFAENKEICYQVPNEDENDR